MNVSMVVIEHVRRRFHQQSRPVDLRSARGAFTHVLKEIVKFYWKSNISNINAFQTDDFVVESNDKIIGRDLLLLIDWGFLRIYTRDL